MSIFDKNTGWVVQRRKGTVDDPFIAMQESISVANGKAVLTEIPQEFEGVTIENDVKTFFTKKTGTPDLDSVVVDYQTGYVYFDNSYDGEQFTASYMGTGSWYLNKSRVVVDFDDNGNVTETLKTLTDTTKDIRDTTATVKQDTILATENANQSAQNADDKASLANTKATLADEKATLAQTVADNANDKATLADQKATLADEKATFAQAQGTFAQEQGTYAKNQGDAVTDVLENNTQVVQQENIPSGVVEGRLWLDTSDNQYQGTVFQDLDEKVDGNHAEVMTQLAQTATKAELSDGLSVKRDKTTKLELEDMSETTLAAIQGGEETTFNLLSDPKAKSVTRSTIGDDVVLTQFKDVAMGKNLFNKSTSQTDRYIDGGGVLRFGSSGTNIDSLSDFIKVKPNTTYSLTNQAIVVFYDKYLNQIGNTSIVTGSTTTIENCDFVKLSYRSENVNTLQFEEGASSTSYEPYKIQVYGLQVESKKIITNDIPDEITHELLLKPDYIRPMLNDVARRVNEKQTLNTLTFGFITDTHTTENLIRFASTIAEASNYVNLDFICHGGDIIDGVLPKETELSFLRRTMRLYNKANTPFIFCKGDHDDNNWYARNNGNLLQDYITNLELYNHTTRFYENELVIGDKERQYYYKDDKNSKIRTIFINTHDLPNVDAGDGTSLYNDYEDKAISNDQLNWVAHVALNFTEKENPNEWGVVLVGHSLDRSDVQGRSQLAHILNNYTLGTRYVNDESNDYYQYSIDVDFSTQGQGEVICMIRGHMHRDSVHDNFFGVRVITTLHASLSTGTTGNPTKTLGTETETAWDIFTINRDERKIYTTRFGAGQDRIIEY